MDPLSISASIIAIIQISTVVSSHCIQYVRSAKNMKTELLRLIQEIGGLQIVLNTLKQLTDRGTDSEGEEDSTLAASENPYLLPTLRKLCKLEYVFEECLRKLKRLERDIAPPDNNQSLSKKDAIIRALRWPIKETYMRAILEDINQYISLFSLALSLDETNAILDIHEKSSATYSTVKSLKSLHDGEKKRRDAADIVEWLSAPDASIDYVDALNRKAKDTGLWLITGERYERWKRNPGSLLWIRGTTGRGKTILSSTVIEDLLHSCGSDINVAVAYFFFKRDDASKKTHIGMLRSFIKQLFEHSNRESEALAQLYERRNQQATSSQLISILDTMASRFERIYIVLDALDECEEIDGLFEALEEMGRWGPCKTHILLTSRDQKDIRDFIEPISVTQDHIKLSADVIQEDIRTYIRERLRTDSYFKRWRAYPQVQEQIETSLTKKSDGMFQWVMCQLKALRNCHGPPQLRQALESMPKTLNGTYAQMLSEISEKNYDLAVRIFQWLLFSVRPLHLEELAELAAVDFDVEPPVIERFWEADEILKICPGLITTMEERAGKDSSEPKVLVKLAHISVREYLLSSDILKGQAAKFHTEKIPSHIAITEFCLSYMKLIDKPVADASKDLPLANYISENWLNHYDMVPEQAQETHELVIEFLLNGKKPFSHWASFYFSLYPPRVHSDILDSILNSPLNLVSAYGFLPALKLLFKRDEVDTTSELALRGALRSAYRGRSPPRPNVETVRLLLEHGADFSGDAKFFHTLHAASYYGFDEIVAIQLDEGLDVNTRGGTFDTALQAAVRGRYDRHFFEPKIRQEDGSINYGAVYENLVPTTVKLLLEKGADPNLCDRQESSALVDACVSGDFPCVKLLLEYGADPNYSRPGIDKGNWDFTRSCLSAACCSKDIRIIQLLLDHGADINSPRVLEAAAFRADANLLRYLLEKGADLNVIDANDLNTPLHLACWNGRPESVEILLEYGAKIDDCNDEGARPFHTAAMTYGAVKILKQLIDRGADVNCVGGDHGTALQSASYIGDTEMVQYLIDNGADVNIRTGYYGCALRAAMVGPQQDAIVILLSNGADLECSGSYGSTLQGTLASIPKDNCEIFIELESTHNATYRIFKKPLEASFSDFDRLEIGEFQLKDEETPPDCVCSIPPILP